VTGTPLRPVTLRESTTPGENMAGGGLAIYRPRINAAPQGNGASAARPAPAHVQTLTNVHPVNTTIYNNNRGNINNTNITNTTTNNTINTINTTNNVNNRAIVNPSNTLPSGNNGQPADPRFSRPNTTVPANTGTPVTAQTSSKPPVTNRPPGQSYNHLPASSNAIGSGHPGQPATNPNTFKPGTPKGQNPAPPKPKTESTRRRQN